MFVTHKLKKNETLNDVLKRYKVRDNILAKLPQNKPLMRKIKKIENISAGDTIHVPDPRAKCYVMTYLGKKIVLSESEWKAMNADIRKNLKSAAEKAKHAYIQVLYGHEALANVQKKDELLTFLTSNWIGDVGDEPKKQQKKAEASVRRLQGIINGGDFGKVASALKQCERDVAAYKKGFYDWREQHIGSGENWVQGLELYRDGSYIFLSALAMTAAAPATVGAGLLIATGMGAQAGLLKSAVNELGRAASGEKMTVAGISEAIATEMVKSAASAAISAGVAMGIIKLAAPALIRLMTSSKLVSAAVKYILSRGTVGPDFIQVTQKSIIQAQKLYLTKLIRPVPYTQWHHDFMVKMVVQETTKTFTDQTAKLVLRLASGAGMSALNKWLIGPSTIKIAEGHLQDIFKSLKAGTDQMAVAAELARRMEKSGDLIPAIEAIITDKRGNIENELVDIYLKQLAKNPDIQKLIIEIRGN